MSSVINQSINTSTHQPLAMYIDPGIEHASACFLIVSTAYITRSAWCCSDLNKPFQFATHNRVLLICSAVWSATLRSLDMIQQKCPTLRLRTTQLRSIVDVAICRVNRLERSFLLAHTVAVGWMTWSWYHIMSWDDLLHFDWLLRK